MALLVAIALYVVLPEALIIGPRWFVPGLEAVLVLTLTIRAPVRHPDEQRAVRVLAVAVIAVINVANITSVALLVHRLLDGSSVGGATLIYSAILVWLTNVIVFGLWFWELDRGGPGVRGTGYERWPDFAFVQMQSTDLAQPGWHPRVVDYLYVSFTNATAFSPTDTMPLTVMAKVLMGAASLVSLVTVVVVAARAINILR